MNHDLLNLLRCPATGQGLRLDGTRSSAGSVETGEMVSEDGKYRYPIRNGIPRFVPATNYADNFGMQWNHFSRTQLDSHSGQPISASRFWEATQWAPQSMKDRWVLDVGCGAGRFAEVALSTGAHVVAVDYSTAVDACASNHPGHPRLHVVQGDVFHLPFAPGTFDFVYSLGVLQHTPDVARAFAALPPMLAPGGKLCVDYYEKSLLALVHPKYLLRPFTKRMRKDRLFAALERVVPVLLPLSQALAKVPLAGTALQRIIPVSNDAGALPLNEQQRREWALLDTFDWLAPEYDNPQSETTARRWMVQAGLADVAVHRAGHLVARGVKRS